MDSKQIYRLIAGDRFDLLSDEERERLAEALIERPGVDPLDVSRRLRDALSDAEEPERERAFRDALAAAESAVRPPAAPLRRAARATRGIWQVALVAAAVAIVAWALFGLRGGVQDDRSLSGDVLFLGAERGAGDAAFDIDASSSSPDVTLVFEARAGASPLYWRVVSNARVRVAGGVIEFSGGASGLRPLAVQVPKPRLEPTQLYWLVVEDADREVLHRWSFRVE